MFKMTPGWIPDRRQKMSNKCPKIIRFPFRKMTFDDHGSSPNSLRRLPMITKKRPTNFPTISKRNPNDHQQMLKKSTTNQNAHDYSSEIYELISDNPWISLDYSWIILWYLWIMHGKLESSPCVSLRLLSAVSFQRKRDLVFGIKNIAHRKLQTRERRAARNDSDPFNQFFLNFHKQPKYEETHGGKIYECL